MAITTRVTASLVSQNTSSVSSVVRFTVYLTSTGNSYNNLGMSSTLSVSGGASGSWNFTSTIGRNTTNKVIRTQDVTVSHNKSTGQASAVRANVSIVTNTSSGTISASTSYTPPAISVTAAPNTPTGVTATRSTDASIAVSWTNRPTTGAITNNTLQVQVDDGSWTNVSTSIGGSTTSYTYTGGTANHRYRFRVQSRNSAGSSGYGYSDYVYTTPAAPTGGFGVQIGDIVGATAYVSNINWPDNFEWQRSSNGSSWTTISGEDFVTSSITETTSINQPYYRVRCMGLGGLYSAYSPSFRVAKSYQIWLNMPEGTDPSKIFVNVPNGESITSIKFQV